MSEEQSAVNIPPVVPIEHLVIPIRDRVIVKQFKVDYDKPTHSGLYIPEKAREQPFQGRVVAVGDGRIMPNGQQVPLTVKVGDEILFGRFCGTEVKVNGEEYMMLREDEIVGCVKVASDELRQQSALGVKFTEDGSIEEPTSGPIVSGMAERYAEGVPAADEDDGPESEEDEDDLDDDDDEEDTDDEDTED